MWTKAFWKAVPERMVRGGAIAVAAVWITGQGILDIAEINDWVDVASLFASGAVGSLILSLAGGAFGPGDGPSLTGREDVIEDK